ncbi:ArsR/SmtB family transcription factor [Mucilaginibacter sp. AW1-3]
MKMDLKKAEKISKALGDPYRLRIIEAIHNEGDWLAHSVILNMFTLAQSTISHHIKQLTDTSLLLTEKEGRNFKYQINKETFGAYIRYLNRFEG